MADNFKEKKENLLIIKGSFLLALKELEEIKDLPENTDQSEQMNFAMQFAQHVVSYIDLNVKFVDLSKELSLCDRAAPLSLSLKRDFVNNQKQIKDGLLQFSKIGQTDQDNVDEITSFFDKNIDAISKADTVSTLIIVINKINTEMDENYGLEFQSMKMEDPHTDSSLTSSGTIEVQIKKKEDPKMPKRGNLPPNAGDRYFGDRT